MVVTYSQIEGILVIILLEKDPITEEFITICKDVPREGNWNIFEQVTTPESQYEIEVVFQNGILFINANCERGGALLAIHPAVVRIIYKKLNGALCEEVNNSYYQLKNTFETRVLNLN